MNLLLSSALFVAVPCAYDLCSVSQYKDFFGNFLLTFHTLFLIFLSFSVLLLCFHIFSAIFDNDSGKLSLYMQPHVPSNVPEQKESVPLPPFPARHGTPDLHCGISFPSLPMSLPPVRPLPPSSHMDCPVRA